MGVLLVAPFLLSFWPRHRARELGWSGRLELAVMLSLIALVTYFLFQNRLRLEYLVLPFIAVAAWRFRLRGATPAALIASLVAGWSAVHGHGPFEDESLFEKMVALQAFNLSISLASFLLAAYADAREQSEQISRLTSYLAILSEAKLGPPPPKWRSILNVMADKAWQVDRIINELVDAARIEAKPQAPERGYLDLRDVVRRAVDRARARAEMSGARIAVTVAPQPVPVDGDARQIGRILDNLINNSLTYVSRPPRLKLNAAAAGGRAVVHVIDNGIGMSKNERDRVFEPFRRTKNPAFSSVPGVGLGLYASRQLAEVNEGTLTLLKSEPGIGTSFALEFPISRSKPPS
jgi:signal transduction histidine kinase